MDLVFITIPETKSTFFEDNFNNKIGSLKAVSYTHLTLPTTD